MTATTAEPAKRGMPRTVRDRADVHRQVKLVVVSVLAVALLAYFWLATDDPHVLFGAQQSAGGWLGNGSGASKPTSIDITPIQIACTALALVVLILAALDRVPHGWVGNVVYVLLGAAFFVGFYLWMYVDQAAGSHQVSVVEPFSQGIHYATPMVLGALAGCLCERAGVINIAIEGQLLLGAFLSAAVATLAAHLPGMPGQLGSILGMAGGILGGVAISALLALFAMRYKVNQVVVGVVLTAFATGLTAFFYGQLRGNDAANNWLNNPVLLTDAGIPGLDKIPFIGKILFDQTVIVYVMYVCIVGVWFLLFQTRWGLRVRSVGEHPTAADTVGIKVNRMRWQAVLLGGVVAGLGGAALTIGDTGPFQQDMSAGKGFIALAAVIMGRWHPIWATCCALFFGMMVSLQVQFNNVHPAASYLFTAMPYVAVIVAVAGFIGRVRPPAADGEPYEKQ
ncbi:MAG: ABC transporter permease [Nocardioides sp.]|uniref:ABC transporter permease n=1 Tax=Nocardioides sp. TaxID=35761 RepID=UPI0039E4809B